MCIDYYEEANKISKLMKNEGFNSWAQKVIDSIKAGFTATEILIELKWNFSQFLKKESTYSNELKNKVKNIIKEINLLLNN
ncbi:MAG: hypothetical protein GF353_18790 [Candidatus Lokiarchaeota archaeon]|nr:hypothetical protein [Candidatus Lokiarchaeota archaeon]